MSTQIPLVFVEKDDDLRTHVSKDGVVTWSDGSQRPQRLPACGTAVDATALMAYTGDVGEVTCGRCQHTRAYRDATG